MHSHWRISPTSLKMSVNSKSSSHFIETQRQRVSSIVYHSSCSGCYDMPKMQKNDPSAWFYYKVMKTRHPSVIVMTLNFILSDTHIGLVVIEMPVPASGYSYALRDLAQILDWLVPYLEKYLMLYHWLACCCCSCLLSDYGSLYTNLNSSWK